VDGPGWVVAVLAPTGGGACRVADAALRRPGVLQQVAESAAVDEARRLRVALEDTREPVQREPNRRVVAVGFAAAKRAPGLQRALNRAARPSEIAAAAATSP